MQTGIYQHYKGKSYNVIGLAEHTETGEILVVYQALYDEGKIWVRPLAIFNDIVDSEGEKLPRFKFMMDSDPLE